MNNLFKFYTVNVYFFVHDTFITFIILANVWLVTWILTEEPSTADCRYHAVQYNRVFHTAFALHVLW